MNSLFNRAFLSKILAASDSFSCKQEKVNKVVYPNDVFDMDFISVSGSRCAEKREALAVYMHGRVLR